jgi:nitrile hydratase
MPPGHAHQMVPSDLTLRVKSLESLLVEKGLVDRAALDALVDTFENQVGPRNGARVVAKAWVDPTYKKRLLADCRKGGGKSATTGRGRITTIRSTSTPSNVADPPRYEMCPN